MAELENMIPEEIAGTEGNTEIFRLAAELGKAIKNDPRMVRFEKAKAAYEGDETVQKLLKEYDVQQAAMQQKAILSIQKLERNHLAAKLVVW